MGEPRKRQRPITVSIRDTNLVVRNNTVWLTNGHTLVNKISARQPILVAWQNRPCLTSVTCSSFWAVTFVMGQASAPMETRRKTFHSDRYKKVGLLLLLANIISHHSGVEQRRIACFTGLSRKCLWTLTVAPSRSCHTRSTILTRWHTTHWC